MCSHMGKHKGDQADENSRLQDKADAFDQRHQESSDRAEAKREAGEYPYDLDTKQFGKLR